MMECTLFRAVGTVALAMASLLANVSNSIEHAPSLQPITKFEKAPEASHIKQVVTGASASGEQ